MPELNLPDRIRMKTRNRENEKIAERRSMSGQAEKHGEEIAARINRSIAYMTEHLDQPLQVAALAALANISPSHFFTLFKRQTGSPPIDYFIRLRMERARQLLDSTASSVKEVAAILGYNDPFYFSRLFKAVNKVAPSDYRQLRKNGKENGSLAAPVAAKPEVRAEFLVIGNGFERGKEYRLV